MLLGPRTSVRKRVVNVRGHGLHVDLAAMILNKIAYHLVLMSLFSSGPRVLCCVCNAGLFAAAIVPDRQRLFHGDGVDMARCDNRPAGSNSFQKDADGDSKRIVSEPWRS